MKMVLITGAGASRELGKGGPLPLMSDWATLLCKELDSREANLAAAIGLQPDMAGDEFERALGRVTTWIRVRTLAPNYFGLTGARAGEIPTKVRQFFGTESDRLESVVEGLRTSLYREFGTRNIDQGLAAATYERLISVLGEPEWLTIATTNYDPSAELALQLIGRNPETGFDRPPAQTPELSPTGLVANTAAKGNVPVLHLHGAVGWYESGGRVLEYAPDQEYNPTHGTPAVLYPDPDKDPTQEAAVKALWVEFEDALSEADRVVVVGHSLNDPILVDALRNSVSRSRLAVTIDTQLPEVEKDHSRSRLEAMLPEAEVFEFHCGESLERDIDFADWIDDALVETRSAMSA